MKRKIHYVSLINQPETEKKPKRKNKKARVFVFSCVLIAGMIISLILPLRPSVSASEKRELAKFPEFSFNALISGDYFDGIDTWFSDTFPFREALTGINTKLTSWYGFGDRVSSMTGDTGDEIPDAPTRPDENDTPSSESTTEKPTEKPTETHTEKPTEASTEHTTEKTDPDKNTAAQKTETLGGILVAGNAGYEYYNFVKSTADQYISVINRVSKRLGKKANVYDVLVPTSIDITLDDTTRKSVSSDDQKRAMDYIYGSMRTNIKTTNIYDILKAHRNEYIYFRTDHHWTALGAYYAYSELMKTAGLKPVALKSFDKVSYGPFLGSFYSDTKQNKKLEKNADELIAFKPGYQTNMYYIDNKGNKYTWPLIKDVTDYKPAYKYSCFAAGDQPYVKIVNGSIKKGSSCVVVKESFGNAMIPFIAGNYKKVYVLDYRYWNGKFYDFIEQKKVKDVFFINNMSATRSKMLVSSLDELCK